MAAGIGPEGAKSFFKELSKIHGGIAKDFAKAILSKNDKQIKKVAESIFEGKKNKISDASYVDKALDKFKKNLIAIKEKSGKNLTPSEQKLWESLPTSCKSYLKEDSGNLIIAMIGDRKEKIEKEFAKVVNERGEPSESSRTKPKLHRVRTGFFGKTSTNLTQAHNTSTGIQRTTNPLRGNVQLSWKKAMVNAQKYLPAILDNLAGMKKLALESTQILRTSPGEVNANIFHPRTDSTSKDLARFLVENIIKVDTSKIEGLEEIPRDDVTNSQVREWITTLDTLVRSFAFCLELTEEENRPMFDFLEAFNNKMNQELPNQTDIKNHFSNQLSIEFDNFLKNVEGTGNPKLIQFVMLMRLSTSQILSNYLGGGILFPPNLLLSKTHTTAGKNIEISLQKVGEGYQLALKQDVQSFNKDDYQSKRATYRLDASLDLTVPIDNPESLNTSKIPIQLTFTIDPNISEEQLNEVGIVFQDMVNRGWEPKVRFAEITVA